MTLFPHKSQCSKLMKHRLHMALHFVDCRHFTEIRPIKKRDLEVEVKLD